MLPTTRSNRSPTPLSLTRRPHSSAATTTSQLLPPPNTTPTINPPTSSPTHTSSHSTATYAPTMLAQPHRRHQPPSKGCSSTKGCLAFDSLGVVSSKMGHVWVGAFGLAVLNSRGSLAPGVFGFGFSGNRAVRFGRLHPRECLVMQESNKGVLG
nr:hypothetical protein [Tanacetum cinerariifolium]